MIASDYDFEKFVSAIKGKDYYEVIYLAEQEATQAWRRNYRSGTARGLTEAGRQYQEKLIGLIDFMRHGIKPRTFDARDLQLCVQLQDQPQRSASSDTISGHENLRSKG